MPFLRPLALLALAGCSVAACGPTKGPPRASPPPLPHAVDCGSLRIEEKEVLVATGAATRDLNAARIAATSAAFVAHNLIALQESSQGLTSEVSAK